MHVIMIEYVDFMMELVNCFEGPADSIEKNQTLQIYRKRMVLIKNCFWMIDTNEIMKHCWFLCNSFHFKKISTIFDGELNMLKQVYLRIVSFLRKMSKNI